MKILPNKRQLKVGDTVELLRFEEVNYPYIGWTERSMGALVGKTGKIEFILSNEETEGDGVAYDVLSRLWPESAVKLVKKRYENNTK